MGNLKRNIRKHKTGIIIGGLVVVFFTIFSVINGVHVAHDRAAENAKQEQAISRATSDTDNNVGNEEEKIELTGEQKEQISKYDDAAKKFIATLEASTWTGESATDTLRFTHGSQFTETISGKPTTHTYTISRVTTEEIEGTDEADPGILTTAIFETDTGSHVVTYWDSYSKVTDTDNNEQGTQNPTVLSSATMFSQKNAKYTRAQTVKEIPVSDIDTGAIKLLGGDKNRITKELTNWLAVSFPTVTKADWDKKVNVTYDKHEAETTFTIDLGENGGTMTITATYNSEDDTFAFRA